MIYIKYKIFEYGLIISYINTYTHTLIIHLNIVQTYVHIFSITEDHGTTIAVSESQVKIMNDCIVLSFHRTLKAFYSPAKESNH